MLSFQIYIGKKEESKTGTKFTNTHSFNLVANNKETLEDLIMDNLHMFKPEDTVVSILSYRDGMKINQTLKPDLVAMYFNFESHVNKRGGIKEVVTNTNIRMYGRRTGLSLLKAYDANKLLKQILKGKK